MFVGHQLKGSGNGDEGADESAVIRINLRKAHADRPFAAAQGDKGPLSC